MRDLTNLKTFIIDSKDPKEVDDAFSLELIEGNIKKLWIHISNPCKLFLTDSKIDIDARGKSSSLYLINQYIPMLPAEIIERANLNQNKVSDTISASIIFNDDGSINKYEIVEAKIKPKYQLIYEDAEEIINEAKKQNKKIVVGYILRHHPTWKKFISISQGLGSPLVMRMNLNQQSSEDQWEVHKKLMNSTSPIVDCGVHYVDVMCQMTKSKPKYVNAIGVNLTDEIKKDMYNYGHLQVVFENGSIGWYEAGWGPMISETAFFVKDVVGPKGSVSIVEPNSKGEIKSDKIDSHTKTSSLLIHNQDRDENGKFINDDIVINTKTEPDHLELCLLEQKHLLDVIQNDLDIDSDLDDVISSMKIVLAADKSIKSGKQVKVL